MLVIHTELFGCSYRHVCAAPSEVSGDPDDVNTLVGIFAQAGGIPFQLHIVACHLSRQKRHGDVHVHLGVRASKDDAVRG